MARPPNRATLGGLRRRREPGRCADPRAAARAHRPSGELGFPPYPYPSATGDRASEAILRPVACPKCPWNARKRPREPVADAEATIRVGVRPRCSAPCPPDTPPTGPSGRGGARTGRCAGTRPRSGCGPCGQAPPRRPRGDDPFPPPGSRRKHTPLLPVKLPVALVGRRALDPGRPQWRGPWQEKHLGHPPE